MTTSIIDAESVIAIDLGSVNTRAALFDVVDGQYHFIAQGMALTTDKAPYRDIGESVHQAIGNLQEITGRVFIDDEARLILPSQDNGTGVDRLVITCSTGPEIRVVLAGLLSDVSLESARHLAETMNARIVETIGLTDRRKTETQLDAIVRSEPDLIILAGGTEGGANRSIAKLVELLTLVFRVIPQERRPRVIYAGNSSLAKRIQEILEKWTRVSTTANIRPSVDVEDLNPAMEMLNQAVTEIRYSDIGGLQQLAGDASTPPMPASFGFGRMVRFLSQVYDPVKGVLGVDLGAATTTVAAAVAGKLSLAVYPYGMGAGMENLLKASSIDEIAQWLPMPIPTEVIRDYLWQKTLFTNEIPMTAETLAIEQAVARQALRLALRQARASWKSLSNAFEPILASGATLSQVTNPAQSLMILLDGLQPVGVTTLNLDQNNLIPRLGAIANGNPILPVQVLESGVIMNLGTVICPISDARPGTPILRVRLEYDQGSEVQMEVRQGSLVTLPLQPGQVAHVRLQALRHVEIDPRGKHGMGSFKIIGGACGAVIDARGRPLALPADPGRRVELIKKWNSALES
jgi:hypothetical protein